ncbi:hypothetical protein EPO05_02000 [Patescibacteria group bacterium]|nr:MAG: hypothetical protein EPO05_02000 [Patescibacteria group bacterium]
MEKQKLSGLFRPQSIAVVGASEAKGKVGNVVAENLLKLGYQGEVFLVNPKYPTLLGQTCYPDVASIGQEVDLAIVIVPAKFVLAVVSGAAERCQNFVIISAGFSEMSAEGKEREAEILKLAEEKDLHILGPNCLGFIVPELHLNASFAGGLPEVGNVALVSQSGAIAVAFMDLAQRESLKFSSIVSIGNKMQLDDATLLEYFEQDAETKVIGMYLEGIKNGERFMEVARRVSAKKPIVVLKAGRTQRAQKAISSHTGALAGSDQITDVVFHAAGILRANNLEQFANLLKLASLVEVPTNDKVIVVTNAGGPGVLTTDAFQNKQVTLKDLSPETEQSLKTFLPEESSVANPIDLLGDAKEDRYRMALEAIDWEDAGTVLCVLTPQDQTPVGEIAEALIAFKQKTKKVVLAAFIGGERVEKAIALLQQQGIPNFPFPEQAVSCVSAFWTWGKNRSNRQESGWKPKVSRQAKAQRILEDAQVAKRKALLFSEAKALMELYAIPTVPAQSLAPGETAKLKAELQYPVVVKVDSDTVLHKIDRQGVILNVQNETDLAAAVVKLQQNFPGERAIIQPMLKLKMELIVGIQRDSTFGSVIMYGLGGTYTEVFKLVDFIVGQPGVEEIERSILSGKLGFLFQGMRGQAPYSVQELAQILSGVLALAHELPSIAEFDINPLLVYNDGTPAVAVDVKVIF